MADPGAGRPARPPGSRALYAISVAAELTGTGQQNIRLYETRGLLTPSRTA
ncbi:MAG: MerR family transcriptional regulator, partial [Arthrobacter sp.]